jgi:hypothetical protein
MQGRIIVCDQVAALSPTLAESELSVVRDILLFRIRHAAGEQPDLGSRKWSPGSLAPSGGVPVACVADRWKNVSETYTFFARDDSNLDRRTVRAKVNRGMWEKTHKSRNCEAPAFAAWHVAS